MDQSNLVTAHSQQKDWLDSVGYNDYVFLPIVDLSAGNIDLVTAQFATNGSRSLLTPASNYSSSIEALLQAALNIEAGNLGSEPDVDAVTHIFLASDRSFGTPGVFRSRWLSPLTEFVDSNNWNISATALVANNLNDVMENNCTFVRNGLSRSMLVGDKLRRLIATRCM